MKLSDDNSFLKGVIDNNQSQNVTFTVIQQHCCY